MAASSHLGAVLLEVSSGLGASYSGESCQSNGISGSVSHVQTDGVLFSVIKKIFHAESNSVRSWHANLAEVQR